jgi:uncharacterized protein (DUF2141 family)
MNYKLFCFLILAILPGNPFAFGQDDKQTGPETGDLVVIVSGLKSSKGVLKIALVDSADNFADKGKNFRGYAIKFKGTEVKWVIEEIPFGRYAIKVYHDADNDGTLDTNFFGKPTESYGFSNNPRVFFRSPTFKETVFSFDTSRQEIEIRLR